MIPHGADESFLYDDKSAFHVVLDETANNTSLASIFARDESQNGSASGSNASISDDGEDPFSRVYGGNFPESASKFKRYYRKNLKVPRVYRSANTTNTSEHSKKRRSGINQNQEQELHSRDLLHARINDLESQIELLSRELLLFSESARSHQPQSATAAITPEKIPSGEKEYYRLQLDKVDQMETVQLQNIVKNMLVLFNTPLSRIQQFIPALAKVLNQEDHYLRFADQMHQELFNEPIASGKDEEQIQKCLETMFKYIESKKLRRA